MRVLQSVHVKAVNNLGPGVEPITDVEFAARIVQVQERVRTYFRRGFKGMVVDLAAVEGV